MSTREDNRLEEQLGFRGPPYRPPFEQWRTECGIGIIGLHWVAEIMHLRRLLSGPA